MSAATDTITITRRDFREAVIRCAVIFRDTGLEREGLGPELVKLFTMAAVGFADGLEAELFKDTDKSDGSIRQ